MKRCIMENTVNLESARHELPELLTFPSNMPPNTRGYSIFGSECARALKGKQFGNREAVAKVKANARLRPDNPKARLVGIQSEGITSVRRIADELTLRDLSHCAW